MNRVDTKIGNRIKSVREAKKMTVEDIKKETGLSKSSRLFGHGTSESVS